MDPSRRRLALACFTYMELAKRPLLARYYSRDGAPSVSEVHAERARLRAIAQAILDRATHTEQDRL